MTRLDEAARAEATRRYPHTPMPWIRDVFVVGAEWERERSLPLLEATADLGKAWADYESGRGDMAVIDDKERALIRAAIASYESAEAGGEQRRDLEAGNG